MNKKTSRVFTLREQLRNIYNGSKGFVLLKTSKKYKLMNKQFKERIMLAITEVNGCEMCSFVHTKLALNSGMNINEIRDILGGESSDIPKNEAVAVLFGQQFAYTKETPSTESIRRLVEEYGFQKAELVLAACNMITMTNGMGTSMDYFYNRIKFNRYHKSSLIIELLNPLLTMMLFPFLVVFQYVSRFFKEIKILNRKYKLNTN